MACVDMCCLQQVLKSSGDPAAYTGCSPQLPAPMVSGPSRHGKSRAGLAMNDLTGGLDFRPSGRGSSFVRVTLSERQFCIQKQTQKKTTKNLKLPKTNN